jgi:hypothetical protein
MATRAWRDEHRPLRDGYIETPVFDASCPARGEWRSMNDVLKRAYSQSWPKGTYERELTFRSTRRYEDRLERFRGTPPRSDRELADALGVKLVGIETIAYERAPFFALLTKPSAIGENHV